MSRHVAPHRWADAAAGRLDARQAAALDDHAARCARCAADRQRVQAARGAFAAIASAPPPDLRWDEVGARVYWSAAQQRRSAEQGAVRPAGRWRGPLGWGLAAAAAAATVAVVAPWPGADSPPAARFAEPAAVAAPTAPAAATAAAAVAVAVAVERDASAAAPPQPLDGLLTLVEGDVRAAGAPLSLGQPVAAGLTYATGDGRLSLQLDAGTAVALGPSSALTLTRLDDAAVELAVSGEVSLEVAPRAPGQRFTVVAGGRVVEVRGTAFEVRHVDGTLEVACRHGLVAVRATGAAALAEVAVPGGHRLQAADDAPLPPATEPLTLDELAALAERAPMRLPAWSHAAAMRRATGVLSVAAPAGQGVRVDGVALGVGALAVRVMAGRHLVELETSPGRFAPGQWVTVGHDAPAAVALPAAPQPPAARRTARRQAVAIRSRELEGAIDHARVRACLRPLAKQGMAAGTSLELEIGVDASGAIAFLNLGATELSPSIAGCIRDAVARARLGAGPAASWRHTLTF